jgi:hypothetical protein
VLGQLWAISLQQMEIQTLEEPRPLIGLTVYHLVAESLQLAQTLNSISVPHGIARPRHHLQEAIFGNLNASCGAVTSPPRR